MTFIEWVRFVYTVCTSQDGPANWREIAIAANVAVALAYFWLPLVMAIVFRQWKREIPFPWIWGGFVVFILACGASHIVHAFHALTEQTPYNAVMLGVLVLTAVVSLATALGFTFLLPKIMALTSGKAARERLEGAVQVATADLERALQHEKLLLREIHHRVKNNLQVTASLVNLHVRRSRQADTTEFHSLRDRITAMADVHAQLQEVGARPLSVRAFAQSLSEKLRISSRREKVLTRVEGTDFEISLDHAVALALILNEVLSNAFKHAFNEDSEGTIVVTLSETAQEKQVLITDDGRGVDQGSQVKGIGTILISSLAVQLGATYDWSDCPDGGTAFLLKIAKKPA